MLADHRDGLSSSSFAWSSIAQSVCQQAFSLLKIRFQRPPGFESCSQQRKTTCLLSIRISLACARASKLTTTNMYMYMYMYTASALRSSQGSWHCGSNRNIWRWEKGGKKQFWLRTTSSVKITHYVYFRWATDSVLNFLPYTQYSRKITFIETDNRDGDSSVTIGMMLKTFYHWHHKKFSTRQPCCT